jgi:flagellar hook-associated protein 3 FlgL
MINGTAYSASAQIAQQQKLSQSISRLQTDISTGTRIEVPSDDPVASARVAQIRQAQADQVTYTRNVSTAQAVASQVDTALSNVTSIMNRVKELTLQGASQTASDNDRQAIVSELNGLNSELNGLMAAQTPTGQDLFPTDAPLLVSVSETVHLPAAAQRSDVFDGVPVVHGGTDTLSSIIANAAAAVSATDPATRSTLTSASLSDIDSASKHIIGQQSTQGLRETRLDSAAEELTTSGQQLAEERSGLEDTDVASTVLQLNAKTLSLQAAQAAFARVNRNTLFDFLS